MKQFEANFVRETGSWGDERNGQVGLVRLIGRGGPVGWIMPASRVMMMLIHKIDLLTLKPIQSSL